VLLFSPAQPTKGFFVPMEDGSMEPELQHRVEETPPASAHGSENYPRAGPSDNFFDSIFLGPHGLRAGWSILLFYGLYYIFRVLVGTVFYSVGLIGETLDNSASGVLAVELIPFISLIGSAAIIARIEGRRISSYNLTGPKRVAHFAIGAVVGFAALSLLVGILAMGGWLQLSSATLSVTQLLRFGVLWACAFLVVASVEEGLFRCYALFTLTRGINFWWALAAEAVVYIDVAFFRSHSNGAWGVYLVVVLGFFPCLALHQKRAARSAFWQAVWVTSTVFGLYHTQNSGENWIGVFAAAAVGFLLCLSVRLTGSVWWAIGFHAAWDWAETFFYGAADSGLQGQGNFLSASPAGNPLWSGGTDGPEGSLMVLVILLALLVFLFLIYGRGKLHAPAPLPAQ
jgi:uncharacterized protein